MTVPLSVFWGDALHGHDSVSSEKIGICAGKHIGTIERGETNPTLTTIVSIMKTLDIEFDKLMDVKKDI